MVFQQTAPFSPRGLMVFHYIFPYLLAASSGLMAGNKPLLPCFLWLWFIYRSHHKLPLVVCWGWNKLLLLFLWSFDDDGTNCSLPALRSWRLWNKLLLSCHLTGGTFYFVEQSGPLPAPGPAAHVLADPGFNSSASPSVPSLSVLLLCKHFPIFCRGSPRGLPPSLTSLWVLMYSVRRTEIHRNPFKLFYIRVHEKDR